MAPGRIHPSRCGTPQGGEISLLPANLYLNPLYHEGINFLGFNLTWRGTWKGRGYLHVEPAQKSCLALLTRLGQILNHQTRWRPVGEVICEANELLRGWAGYFHFRNSKWVLAQMRRHSQNRLRRWLWRKQGCKHGI